MKQFVSKIQCFLDSLCMTLDDICVCTDIYIEMGKEKKTTLAHCSYSSYNFSCLRVL